MPFRAMENNCRKKHPNIISTYLRLSNILDVIVLACFKSEVLAQTQSRAMHERVEEMTEDWDRMRTERVKLIPGY